MQPLFLLYSPVLCAKIIRGDFMQIPQYALEILTRLEAAGHDSYIVGGCVRDSIMGMTPHDYDVTTSALPQETERIFSGYRVIETGLKHGTVTVLSGGNPIEITTFRVDGKYKDGRHPQNVTFTSSIRDDLSRRDFTMNGIAYSPVHGKIDPFGGEEDISNKIIRSIGDPDRRFGEDALRILRGLRFASVLGFEIESETARSIRKNYRLLKNVSAERIFSELKKLLCGGNVLKILLDFPEVFSALIPQLSPMVGYDQGSRYHNSDLYTHTSRAVAAAPSDPAMRIAMLLHDVGKLHCRSTDENGECHYYGHAEKSARIAEDVLRGLKCDNSLLERVCEIIRYHDIPVEISEKYIRRQLSRHGLDRLVDILRAHIADDSAKQPFCLERIPKEEQAIALAEKISAEMPCVSLKQLAVRGSDLMEMIPPSPEMGAVLEKLLSEVIDGALPNERAALMKRAREIADTKK